MLTKGAIGNLINRYKAVLTKCNLINTFGSLAVASMLVLGGAGVAEATDYDGTGQTTASEIINVFAGKNSFDGDTFKNYRPSKGGTYGFLLGQKTSGLNFQDVTFENNQYTNPEHSGHIYGGIVYTEGDVDIKDSYFNYNKLLGNSIKYYDGAVIYAKSGTLDIVNSFFTGNEARTGGAIYTQCATTIDGGMFDSNHARMGGAIRSSNTTLDIVGTKFTNNTGAAIYGSGGKIELSGTSFYGNKIKEGGYGGAIVAQSSSSKSASVVLQNINNFEGNEAKDGGAIQLMSYKDNYPILEFKN
ncbi:hypothetical protein, partial [Mailhella sp.]|uniref:hypothetical protein n=1 Tax=Mailhella sp. TaxID=1981029 RepID=UPI00406458B9